MSDIGGQVRGRVGRGFRDRDRGSGHYTLKLNKKGLCSALRNNVFDYGQKGAAYQMQTTWENIFHYVSTIYGHDISNGMKNKTKDSTPNPEYTEYL